ncbi:hypothetical protein CLOP_g16715 [Closterium sp. NIES-67]|nr:hypothetical protein CLOP_g16715 [Closterium sp. NIES-67]
MTPKQYGKGRREETGLREQLLLILDLRHVNSFLSVPRFRYEGFTRVPDLVQEGDWLFTIDLKSGYHHVDIHPAFWRFLGFSLQGQDYQFLSLPFGLATAPFMFTLLIKQISKRWHRRGIRLIPYVDDILFISATRAEALHNRSIIIADLAAVGFVVNFKKSQLAPAQSLKFLGLLLDTRTTTFSNTWIFLMNDAILVVVDRLTKMAHFTAYKTTITAEQTAKLFLTNIVRLYDIPSAIISDRDPWFTSNFWTKTLQQYGTRLQLSMPYHLQSDGQTERTNQIMEQLIRTTCTDPTQWEDALPLIKFACNNAP